MARVVHGTMQAVFDIAVYSRRERPTRREPVLEQEIMRRNLEWIRRWLRP